MLLEPPQIGPMDERGTIEFDGASLMPYSLRSEGVFTGGGAGFLLCCSIYTRGGPEVELRMLFATPGCVRELMEVCVEREGIHAHKTPL